MTWSEEEVAFLEENYGKMLMRDLAKRLHRTEHGIRKKAKRRHLKDTTFKPLPSCSFNQWNISMYVVDYIRENGV